MSDVTPQPQSTGSETEPDSARVQLGANKPLLLDDASRAWIVATGSVDVFLARSADSELVSPPVHLFRVETGGLLLGIGPLAEFSGFCLLGRGGQGASALSLPLEALPAHAQDTAGPAGVSGLLDAWLSALGRSLCHRESPRQFGPLAPAEELPLTAGTAYAPASGVLWVEHVVGSSFLLGPDGLEAEPQSVLPVSRHCWLHGGESAVVRVTTTAAELTKRTDGPWNAVAEFHRRALTLLVQRELQAVEQQCRRIKTMGDEDKDVLHRASTALANILQPQATGSRAADYEGEDDLLHVCRIVGEHLGLDIQAPPSWQEECADRTDAQDPIWDIVNASRIRARRVILRDAWWCAESGPLVAFLKDDRRPVALLPGPSGKYVISDPRTEDPTPVTEKTAAMLAEYAYCFYRPFPRKVLGIVDLLRHGFVGCRRDIVRLMLMGALGGLLGLATPIFTGRIFDTVVPGAERGQLLQMTLALLAIGVGTAVFSLTQAMAMLRVEGRVSDTNQSALWDRVLSLPVPFFRRFSVGDLHARAMGIDNIRQMIAGMAMQSVFSMLFSIANLALLFYYNVKLALVAMGLVVIALALSAACTGVQLSCHKKMSELQGKLSGTVLQFLSGISRIRVAGAEARAFKRWTLQYTELKQTRFRVESLVNIFGAFNTALSTLSTLVIFFSVFHFNSKAMASGASTMTTGSFVAFNAAYGGFLASMVGMFTQLMDSIGVHALYTRAKPVMEALPEVDPDRALPGDIRGDIEIEHVHFRYSPEGPPILRDVSLRIKPGEFVAVVGASGAGKSTVLRLLLGFEEPTAGTVYFDGRDLASLEATAVRRQLGVFLQNSRVMAGTIYDNIAGAHNLSLDEAWEAAKLAGLEKDLKQMPMGMQTVLNQGGTVLSGGQRQRLLIARAMARKPRIFLLDEATSALDNQTQSVVAENLRKLNVTRLVIAHRLSTVQGADRIYVMDKGQVVEQGTEQELLDLNGLFAQLASAQRA